MAEAETPMSEGPKLRSRTVTVAVRGRLKYMPLRASLLSNSTVIMGARVSMVKASCTSLEA